MTISELYHQFGKQIQVTTDSRNCPVGSVFVALRGDRFDGNRYAAAALEQGCSYAIVDNPDYHVASDPRYLLVPDALQAYKYLAREHRRQFHIPVLAITGTNGKTTTKELTAAVLAQRYRVMATEGNFNNDVGVPKTLFRLNKSHEIAVVEMGASHPGDIRTLVETAEPTCGIISNVGRAHLEGFGSFEGVKRTKGELYDFLAANGSSPRTPEPRTSPLLGAAEVFINADDKDLMEMFNARRTKEAAMLVPYFYTTDPSKAPQAWVIGRVVACNPCLRLAWKPVDDDCPDAPWHEVQTQLIGAYNIYNALAAATIGLHFGVSTEQISLALEQYKPRNNRSQLVETARNRLIVDAYNANPTSMQAAIDNFSLTEGTDKMLILGDMKELGAVSQEAHQQIVDLLQERGFNEVWLVGSEFGQTKHPFRQFQQTDQVAEDLKNHPVEGRLILVKGSHSMHLDTLVNLL